MTLCPWVTFAWPWHMPSLSRWAPWWLCVISAPQKEAWSYGGRDCLRRLVHFLSDKWPSPAPRSTINKKSTSKLIHRELKNSISYTHTQETKKKHLKYSYTENAKKHLKYKYIENSKTSTWNTCTQRTQKQTPQILVHRDLSNTSRTWKVID